MASAISDDGRYVAFFSDATNLAPNDRPGTTDVFVRDRTAGTTESIRLSAQVQSETRCGGMSADGRYVAMISGYFMYRAVVRDRQTGTLDQVGTCTYCDGRRPLW